MTDMRILTVRQPWAWAIIHGGKDVENRVRNLAGDFRGSIAIHAGLADADGAPESLWLAHAEHYRNTVEHGALRSVRGAIIGVVDLVGAHPARHVTCCTSSWAEPDVWHLELANPRPLTNPLPYRGALGLRCLDDATRLLVESELP